MSSIFVLGVTTFSIEFPNRSGFLRLENDQTVGKTSDVRHFNSSYHIKGNSGTGIYGSSFLIGSSTGSTFCSST